MDQTLRQQILENLSTFSRPERPIFLVGGGVRDFLLGRPAHDLDFVMPGETRQVANEIARQFHGALYVLDEERRTTRVILDQNHSGGQILLDFAAFRAESLEADLRARDFTINAMAFDVSKPEHLIDPTGGLGDLREKRIRACSPHSLTEDPVRVLRAVRQALQFQFRIVPDTINQTRSAASLLPRISAERLRDEAFRMLDGPQVSMAIRILDQLGALSYVLPELEQLKGFQQPPPHVLDAWEHTLSVLGYLEQLFPPLVGTFHAETVSDLTSGSAVLWLGRFRQYFEAHFHQPAVQGRSIKALLFLAALYHDIAKPATRTEKPEGKVRFFDHPEVGASWAARRGRQLVLSASEVSRLETIVRHHMRVHLLTGSILNGQVKKLSRRSIYRFFKSTGAAGVDICLLSLADVRGTYGTALPQDVWQAELATCRELIEAYWEKNQEIISPPRLLTGDDVMEAYQIKPGPQVGQLLDELCEAQATGEVETREEALAFLRLRLEQPREPAVDLEGTEE